MEYNKLLRNTLAVLSGLSLNGPLLACTDSIILTNLS